MKFSEYWKNYLIEFEKLPIGIQKQVQLYEESNISDFETCAYLSEPTKEFLRSDKKTKGQVEELNPVLKWSSYNE